MSTTNIGSALDPVGRSAIAKATRRLVPILVLIYFFNFLDRVNIGYAALAMNEDLALTATAFGLAAGLFFIGYIVFEVPSNLIMHKVGARVWIARIMVTWGILSAATAFVNSETQLFIVRFLLGFAEAGLFPGVILYLTYWFPARQRARITALFLLAIPLSAVVGGPASTAILQYADGWFGLESWRVMFLAEGIPTIAIGIFVFFYLTNRPADARWLQPAERDWLTDTIAAEASATTATHSRSIWRVLTNPRVVLLSLVYFGVVYGVYALSFFLPQLVTGLAESFGTEFSFIEVGFITAIPFTVAAVSMWLVGRHSDRSGERILHTALPAFMAALGLVIALYFGESPYVMMLGLTVLAGGVFGAIPSFWTLPPTFLTGAALAGGIGLINSFGNLSGFVGPYVTGWLKDLTGDFDTGLLVVAGCIALAGVITLALGARLRRDVADQPAEAPVPIAVKR